MVVLHDNCPDLLVPSIQFAKRYRRRRAASVITCDQGSCMTAFQASLDLGLQPVAASFAAMEVADRLPRLIAAEPKGVVYTQPWVVSLILDLSGYRAKDDLAALYAVEPSAGAGAFLVPMVRRLMTSVASHGRNVADARGSIRAYELDGDVAAQATRLVVHELREHGVSEMEARDLAQSWIGAGDYLLTSPKDRRADLVVGNPPYIRYDDLPPDSLGAYRRLYPTMVGRCDIYVAFIEAGLRQLKDGGTLAFICADRWMRSAYGAELRRMISAAFGVETVIEMHDAPAFDDEVAAYPAVVVIRRAAQAQAIIASAGPGAGPVAGTSLADAVTGLAYGRVAEVPGFTATTVDHWFQGASPWPALEPHQLHLLQLLEERFAPLEDENTGTKIGIGVATGADRVFVTTDPELVESDRLLPLAMTADTRQGTLRWSGHYLVDPWATGRGLVDLVAYPRLRTYLDTHREKLRGRHIARQRPRDWYRTIDPVHHQLTSEPKLYFPDMKVTSHPVLDRGETYPHHNLYYLTSKAWDLEVLGGVLLSFSSAPASPAMTSAPAPPWSCPATTGQKGSGTCSSSQMASSCSPSSSNPRSARASATTSTIAPRRPSATPKISGPPTGKAASATTHPPSSDTSFCSKIATGSMPPWPTLSPISESIPCSKARPMPSDTRSCVSDWFSSASTPRPASPSPRKITPPALAIQLIPSAFGGSSRGRRPRPSLRQFETVRRLRPEAGHEHGTHLRARFGTTRRRADGPVGGLGSGHLAKF